MLTITRFPHKNLVKENIIQMNQNAIIPNVCISSISYCIKMHKSSETKPVHAKRPCSDHKIV